MAICRISAMQPTTTAERARFRLFIAVGLGSALVDIGAMQSLTALGLNPFMAASVGFLVGLLVNFFFHARLTFHTRMKLASFGRYLGVVGINYLLTMVFVALTLWWLGNAIAGKVVSLPLVAVNGFLLSRHWVFK